MAELKPGDWVTIRINGVDEPARIRGIIGNLCKLELSKYIHLDGYRTKVYNAWAKDIRKPK